MITKTRGLFAALLAVSFIVNPVPPAKACAPDLAYSILVNGNHPDLPLPLFARGNIGVVQAGWAKSYLVVAYRYLNLKPLSAAEQESVVSLWHSRIKNGSSFSSMGLIDERDAYLTMRSKAIGASNKKNMDLAWKMSQFWEKYAIGDASMSQARRTLASLMQKYKPLSPQVRAWVNAQDGVYGLSAQKNQEVVVPAPLPGSADPELQDYRNYQIGAANFYLSNYGNALAAFEKVAGRFGSPLKDLASYMVLRIKAAQVRNVQKDENNAVANLLQSAAGKADKVSSRENILDLLRPINYMNMDSAAAVKMLSSVVLAGGDQRFGGDVGDLTFLLDGNPLHPDTSAPISMIGGDGSVAGSANSSVNSSSTNSSASSSTSSSADSSSAQQSKATEELAAASDLADWVLTIQSSMFADDNFDDSPQAKARMKATAQKNASHALQMWRKTRSTPWLVAAVTTNSLRNHGTDDLYAAAQNVSAASPAYSTCRFYLADALIATGKKSEARNMILPLLSDKSLPPSSRNLFAMQMAAASETTADYLKFAVQETPEVLQSLTDLVSPKFLKIENSKTYVTETPAFDAEVADDISRNAPLSTWMSFSQNASVPAAFRAIVLRATWTRAQLLNRDDMAMKISDAVAASNPVLKNAIAKYKTAPEGPAKQFAGACAVLKFYGMTPYIQGGLQRHGERLDEFDWYNGNYWVPFPVVKRQKTEEEMWSDYETVCFNGCASMSERIKSYGENGLASRLTAAEKKQATSERTQIFKNNPSRYYGQIVLDWAKSHPSDPDVPEMLYRIVKLPKWTTASDVGSEYSRKAYMALHASYPGNKWTRKAVCYY
ncbi:MAG: hypothetical protein EKK48_27315 [Candidatus Melainabacteria bacterium]|nr:MAG: hypothetical protein EKK48_27315 [Candidatus Melainabacteria bacterium]